MTPPPAVRAPAEAARLNHRVAPVECALNVVGNQVLELSAGLLAARYVLTGPLAGPPAALWAASPQWTARTVLHGLGCLGLDGDNLDLEGWLAAGAAQSVVPAAQLLVALFIADTWQYFAHRLFHSNKFLYRACCVFALLVIRMGHSQIWSGGGRVS